MALSIKQPQWKNEKRKLSELIPWERNPRHIKDKQAKLLAESFQDFGQVETIAISPENEIYNGHQRLSVLAGKYGMDYEIDVRVSSRQLTEKERERLTVYLHRGATGEWDFDELANWDMSDLLSWGFEESDFQFDVAPAMGESADAEPQIDKAEELRKKWGVELGQMWRLPSLDGKGEHLLICGDCTDKSVVDRVMGGEKADFVFGDPPYEMDAQLQGEIIDNFNCTIAWFGSFPPLADVLRECKKKVQYDFSWHTGGRGLLPNPNFIIPQHKTILLFADKLPELIFSGGEHLGVGKLCSVINAEYDFEKSHKHEKPMPMVMSLIDSYRSVFVFDGFCGSGTTLIACENLSRYCRAVEISPAYVAVALQRYFDAFGIEPVLIDNGQ